MKSLVVLAVLSSITICKGSADNEIVNGVKTIESFGIKLKKEAQEVESALAPRLAQFNDVIKSGLQKGQDGVRSVYSRALEQLHSAPDHCVQGVESRLLQLQADADKTFLSCSNLTLAVQDLGNLVTYTGDMLLGLARSVQEITWFTNCFSWNPIKSLPCFFEWMGLLYQGSRRLISSLGQFNTELDTTLLHMLRVFEYCEARTREQHGVLSLMAPVHACAGHPLPTHLYSTHDQQ